MLERLDVILAVLIGVMLVVGAWLVTALRAHRVPSVGTLVVIWLLITGATLAIGWTIAFIAVHALLFTLGAGAAAVGILVVVLFTEATPLATGYAVRHWVRQHH